MAHVQHFSNRPGIESLCSMQGSLELGKITNSCSCELLLKSQGVVTHLASSVKRDTKATTAALENAQQTIFCQQFSAVKYSFLCKLQFTLANFS